MEQTLHILWTNDNPQTAHTMVFMYAINAKTKGWWENVDIIIWGATAKLVAEDESIQEKVKMALHAGLSVRGCITCANLFEVADDLEKLGIVLEPMGVPLTNLLKDGEKLLTI